jgi:CotH kinase protein
MKKLTLLLTTVFLFSISKTDAQLGSDLYDASTIHTINISFDQSDWLRLLDSNRLNGDNMLVGKVTIDGVTYDNCGVAYAKSPGYQMDGKRNPWVIKLNLIDSKQSHNGYKTLNLSQALRDPSLVREVLGYEITRKYIAAPRANYANLNINGEAKGVYVNVEAVDEAFLQKNFGNTEGAFVRCVPDPRGHSETNCDRTVFGSLRYEKNAKCYLKNYDLLSKTGWEDVIELTRVLNNEPQNIGKILNVDRTLWYLALQNVMVNLNSYTGQYSGNFYLYRDANGLFNIIPTEMNLAFGSYKNATGGSDFDFEGLVSLDPYLHEKNEAKPLISQLLKNPEYKKIYMAHFRQILNDCFLKDVYSTRASALQSLITASYANMPEKPYSLADFQRSLNETVGNTTKIPGIFELMSRRAALIRKHPDMLTIPPQISDIQFSPRARFTAKTVTEFRIKTKVDNFPKMVRLMYRPVGSTENFRELRMLDDGASHDGAAGDKVFGAVVAPKGFDAIEYYIVADNAGAATFEPANYMQERKKISLKELNQ